MNGDGDVVAAVAAGDVVGELALFQPGVRRGTVISAEDDTIVGAFAFEDLAGDGETVADVGFEDVDAVRAARGDARAR